jgi:hypothetical protein
LSCAIAEAANRSRVALQPNKRLIVVLRVPPNNDPAFQAFLYLYGRREFNLMFPSSRGGIFLSEVAFITLAGPA